MTNYFLNLAKTLYKNGYSVIPIAPREKYPELSLKKHIAQNYPNLNPGLDGWQRLRNYDQQVLNDLINRFPESGIGVATFNTPAIDIDIKDAKIVHLVAKALKPILSDGIILIRIGLAPKILIPCQLEGKTFQKLTGHVFSSKTDDHQLEIHCNGQQFVGFGTHKDTGQDYRWLNEKSLLEVKRTELPMLDYGMATEIQERVARIIAQNTDWCLKKNINVIGQHKPLASVVSIEKVKPPVNQTTTQIQAALKLINADDRGIWIKVGMGFHHQYQGRDEGFNLWDTWSQSSHKYNPGDMQSKWKSFKRDNTEKSITAASILEMAKTLKNQPRPLPEYKLRVLPFDYNMIPDALVRYIKNTSDRIQCAPDFIAVSVLCSLASLLGNQAVVKPKVKDNWWVYPTLWGMLIGNPSAKKSPAYKTALKPLYAIEKKMRQEYAQDLMQYKAEKTMHNLEKDMAKLEAKKLMKKDNDKIFVDPLDDFFSGEPNQKQESEATKAKQLISDANSNEPIEPTMKRLTVNDTTMPKLGMLLNENPNGLLYERDELHGLLDVLGRDDQSAERAFLLECFNGDGVFTFDRVGRGTITIEQCTLSIVGTIQPTLVGRLLLPAIQNKKDDGFFQRFQLAVFPEQVKQFYHDPVVDEATLKDYENLVETFYQLDFKDENDQPKIFSFDDDAQEVYTQWYNQNCKESENPSHSALYIAHLVKMRKTIPTLALLFELISTKGEANSISLDAIVKACRWSDYLQSHAKVIYGELGNNDLINARRLLAEKEKLNQFFTVRDIRLNKWSGLTENEAIEEALDILVDFNHIVIDNTPQKSGRKTKRYYFNQAA